MNSTETGAFTSERNDVAVKSMLIAGFTTLLYDHILTFGSEVELVWKSRTFGPAGLIFLANRYVVPCMLAVDIFENFFLIPQHALVFCKAWTVIQSYLTIASFLSLHVVVALRVNALYVGNRRVRYSLVIAGMLYALSTLAMASIISARTPVISHIKVGPHSCVGLIPPYLWATWLPSILFESFLFVLTVLACPSHLFEYSDFGALYRTLFRDGLIYFLAVSLCSLFSLIVWAVAGPTLIGLARYYALAMVNVAGSRLTLNLKAFTASQMFFYELPRYPWQMELDIPANENRPRSVQSTNMTHGSRQEEYVIGQAI